MKNMGKFLCLVIILGTIEQASHTAADGATRGLIKMMFIKPASRLRENRKGTDELSLKVSKDSFGPTVEQVKKQLGFPPHVALRFFRVQNGVWYRHPWGDKSARLSNNYNWMYEVVGEPDPLSTRRRGSF